MMHSPKGRRAALENEPAYKSNHTPKSQLPWRSRQTNFDLFLEWLTEWRRSICSPRFIAQLEHGRERAPR